MAVAPFAVEILTVSTKSEECIAVADRLYSDLTAMGVEVLYDDRDDSAGVKFKDADLVGMPLRVTVGDRGLKSGVIEARVRRTGEVREVPVKDAAQGIMGIIETLE
jgi:prolyl-tRNA synthetase